MVVSSLATAQEILTLDSCLSYAKQRNCTIQSAQLEVAISREVKKQMLWKYFPQVSLNAFTFGAAQPLVQVDVTQMGSSEGMRDLLTSVFDLLKETDPTISPEVKWIRWGASATGTAIQPIYWGGQIVTANKLAKLGIDVSQLKQEVSERDVLQEVAETYWMVAGLQEKQATVDKTVALLDTISNVANIAFTHGLVTRNDLLRVQLKQNEIQSKALQLEDGIELASRLLCVMIGQEYTGPLMLQPLVDNTIDALPERPTALNVERRPESQLLEANIRYQQLMRRLTLGESLPHIGLGVTGGYSNFFEKDRLNGIAFAFITIPLTKWGETSHQLKQYDLRIRQAEMMQSDLSAKMNLQNLQAYNKMTEAAKLAEQHRSAAELAQDNYNLALMNYRAGVMTMSELLEAEALLMLAQNSLTDARINYLTALRKYMSYGVSQ